ncbi:MAG: A24 family peptidase, partial [Raoultibacter sp.]
MFATVSLACFAPLSLLVVVACGAAGLLIPFAADKIMRRKSAEYHAWFVAGARGFATFTAGHRCVPDAHAAGEEGAWGLWAAHAVRLVGEGGVSQEECREVADIFTAEGVDAEVLERAGLGDISPDECSILKLPTAREVERTFSCKHKLALALPCAGCAGALVGALDASGVGDGHPAGLAAGLLLVGGVIVVACLALALIDAKCRIIPTELTVVIATAGALWQGAQGISYLVQALLCALVVWAVLRAIDAWALWRHKEHGVGGGDMRATPAAALVAGFPGIISGCAAAGLAFGAFALIAGACHRISTKTKVAFGPFIAVIAI